MRLMLPVFGWIIIKGQHSLLVFGQARYRFWLFWLEPLSRRKYLLAIGMDEQVHAFFIGQI
jgi:hypothetical protein